jgi:hypothetical protein
MNCPSRTDLLMQREKEYVQFLITHSADLQKIENSVVVVVLLLLTNAYEQKSEVVRVANYKAMELYFLARYYTKDRWDNIIRPRLTYEEYEQFQSYTITLTLTSTECIIRIQPKKTCIIS